MEKRPNEPNDETPLLAKELVLDAPTHLQNQRGGGFRVSGWSYVVVLQNTCPQNGHRS